MNTTHHKRCGNCVAYEDQTNHCIRDCNGELGGTAYLDSCQTCVGGSTGKVPCLKDCSGQWGGVYYNNSLGMCVDTAVKPPCDTLYKLVGDSLTAFIDKPEFQDSLNRFKQGLGTDSVEKSMTLGMDSATSIFKASGIFISSSTDSSFSSLVFPTVRVLAPVHSHPSSDYNCFSAGDLYYLAYLFTNTNYNHIIRTQYLYSADSTLFAMAIEDSAKFVQFYATHPPGLYMDATHGFDTATDIGRDFYNAFIILENTLVDDDAFTQATAYVYAKYNTGVILFRRKKGEAKLRRINTGQQINSDNQITYFINNCL